jgi:DNA-binding NarL/FixJ family response regulator
VTLHALHLVRAGGVFVPVDGLLASPSLGAKPTKSTFGMFTAKQAAVIEAIRRGKANKAIAYELNMCESTVKVHVRTIMKKLKANNRTQVAYIANQMLNERAF